ncbi:MAG: DUF4236 domain-containing protein [Victivallales bacterium]|nr:DUF4236 domain-containing protein [Victivallales bacterium]
MGFRFRKSISLLPGVRLNITKSGPSLSIGPRGAKANISTKGVRGTVGIPGTGMSWSQSKSFSSMKKGASGSEKTSSASTKTSTRTRTAAPQPEPQSPESAQISSDLQKLEVNFFSKLFLSGDEKKCIEGIKAYLHGNRLAAMVNLREAAKTIPDAAFTAAFISLDDDPATALQMLDLAEAHIHDLGKFYVKYGLSLTMSIQICEGAVTDLQPEPRALTLARVEVLQQQGEYATACNLLTALLKQHPNDLLATISLADLVLDSAPEDKAWLQTIVKLTATTANSSPLHTVLLYFRAIALATLDQTDLALETVSTALRSTAGRPPTLLVNLYALKGTLLESQGKMALAKRAWQQVYALAPDYEGIEEHLAIE